MSHEGNAYEYQLVQTIMSIDTCHHAKIWGLIPDCQITDFTVCMLYSHTQLLNLIITSMLTEMNKFKLILANNSSIIIFQGGHLMITSNLYEFLITQRLLKVHDDLSIKS